MDFRLPALGEGIDSATVVNVLVKAGDSVKAGQPVVSVETDKAAVDVEAEAAGSVSAVHVKAGDKLAVGALILTYGGSANGVATAKPATAVPLPPQLQTCSRDNGTNSIRTGCIAGWSNRIQASGTGRRDRCCHRCKRARESGRYRQKRATRRQC